MKFTSRDSLSSPKPAEPDEAISEIIRTAQNHFPRLSLYGISVAENESLIIPTSAQAIGQVQRSLALIHAMGAAPTSRKDTLWNLTSHRMKHVAEKIGWDGEEPDYVGNGAFIAAYVGLGLPYWLRPGDTTRNIVTAWTRSSLEYLAARVIQADLRLSRFRTAQGQWRLAEFEPRQQRYVALERIDISFNDRSMDIETYVNELDTVFESLELASVFESLDLANVVKHLKSLTPTQEPVYRDTRRGLLQVWPR